MKKQTKIQKEFVEAMSTAIDLRLALEKRIAELMADRDFPNSPSWIARMLVNEYEIKPRK